eukprot:CAMPEP_0114048882 /NCGR_PEP_ID=MMETSP1339-20121228/52407_1 /TAXON_ID=94617 /ORGANISM="Fibrocapsa japonica" /LENGTH=43 /assembly_acc=CAM_ASM_000762
MAITRNAEADPAKRLKVLHRKLSQVQELEARHKKGDQGLNEDQ